MLITKELDLLVSLKIIVITIGIVVFGIVLYAFGSSVLKWVEEKPTDLEWPWQDIINGLADLGTPFGQG